MDEKIMLWPHPAPDSAFCGAQSQPSMKPYPAAHARGAVLVCPGGSYEMKCALEGGMIAEMLTAQGIAAYLLDYRVAPCQPLTPLHDAQRALRILRSMGYEKVGILGFSSAGHLASCAAVYHDAGDPEAADPIQRFSCRPDAFVPCYPVVSFGEYTHPGSRKNLLGELSQDAAWQDFFSVHKHIAKDTPPAFIWHTAADSVVPVQNALLLAKALADQGVPFECHVYPAGEHGLALAEKMPPAAQWANACCRWLLERGFGA